MVLRIGVRIPAPQLQTPGSISKVAAPTVLILAAGQGTRMRSQTPKVLHELCGRPMVLWPVQAALQAGAGRVVVLGGFGARGDSQQGEGADAKAEEQPTTNDQGADSHDSPPKDGDNTSAATAIPADPQRAFVMDRIGA